jgi:Protein of unknown function (DUF429)
MDFDKSSLYRRTTDALIAERTEANPLPVSVDKIGYCAIRAAVLVGEIARLTSPEAAARDGSGIVCEVYPAPAIRRWLDVRGYTGAAGTAIRAEMVDRIVGATRMCDPFRLLERARESPDDDLLDALICALLGRACELGQTDPVPPSIIKLRSRRAGSTSLHTLSRLSAAMPAHSAARISHAQGATTALGEAVVGPASSGLLRFARSSCAVDVRPAAPAVTGIPYRVPGSPTGACAATRRPSSTTGHRARGARIDSALL